MKLKDLQSMNGEMETEKKWYVVYARKSSESEDRQIESIPDQLKVLKELAIGKNLPVLGKPFTEVKSAKAPGRPVFDEMSRFVKSHNDIKGIVCWKLNRLTRNPVDTGSLQWLLQTGAIEEIVTPSKTYTEIDSDFIMAVEGAQANRFIRDLKEDTQRGIDSKLEKGFAPILAPPGYRNNIEKRQGEKDISPHPTYFTLMRKLFELALTGNFTLQNLVVKSQELGIKNSRGKTISKSQMAKVMRNPFYTGRFIYGEKLYHGKHQPMLTDEEYDLLQDILSGRSRPRKQKHDFWHTGIPILCGECGCQITGDHKVKHYKNGTFQIFNYARCTKKGKGIKCSQRYVEAKELERQVLKILGTMKLSQKFVDWAIKWLNVVNQGQNEARETQYNALKNSYEEVVGKIKNLLNLKISPDNRDGNLISNEEYNEERQKLLNEKAKVQENLGKVDRHINEWTELAAKTFDFAATAQERFASGDIEDRKIILRAIGSHLILKDRKLTIEARTPFSMIQKAVDEMKDFKRLAPDENANVMPKTGDLPPQSLVWGG